MEDIPWDNYGSKKDKNAFLFSFNNKQKYTHRNNNGSIYCDENCCPWFGGSGFPEIYFDSTLNKGRSWEKSSYNTFIIGRKLTNGEEYWNVKELEVFKITYI